MAGVAGEEDLFDGVVVAVDLAVDDRAEGRFLRHGPEAGGDEHLFADTLSAIVPAFFAGRRREGEVAVEVLRLAKAGIAGLLIVVVYASGIRLGSEERPSDQEDSGGEEVGAHGEFSGAGSGELRTSLRAEW
jgi:hypothetical protein